jgi:hypothetical protein
VKKHSSASILRVALFSFILLILFCVWGCKNPFKTRSSPPPEFSEGTWETPALPRIVLDNLLHAYNEKIIDNFSECLSDSFVFSAPEDSIDATNEGRDELFANWDKTVEVKITDNVFKTFEQNSDSIDYVLSFHPASSFQDEEGDTIAVLYRDYQLLISESKGANPETTVVKGTAAFHMEKTPLNLWSIYFWRELLPLEDYQDWAQFKAQFRQ